MIWVTKHAAATKIANGAGTHTDTNTHTNIKHTQTLHLTHLLLGTSSSSSSCASCCCHIPLLRLWLLLFGFAFFSLSFHVHVFSLSLGFISFESQLCAPTSPLPTSYCATVPHPASLSNLPTPPRSFLFYGDVVIVCSVHSHTHSATHAYSNTLRHTWLRIRNNLVTKMLLFRATFLCVCVCMCV